MAHGTISVSRCSGAPWSRPAMLAATLPSYRRLCRWSYTVYGLSILHAGWSSISFGSRVHCLVPVGISSSYSSEFAKLAFVLFLGRYLMYREITAASRGLLSPCRWPPCRCCWWCLESPTWARRRFSCRSCSSCCWWPAPGRADLLRVPTPAGLLGRLFVLDAR